MPYNILSFQYSKSGLGYADIIAFYNQFDDSREYMQAKLLKKLQINKTYCVIFFVNLVNYSTCAIDQIGAYFDDGSVNSPPDMVVNGIINPQVSNPTGSILTDTLNWVKIQGTFIATGTEEYITIGNFKPATLTNTVSVDTSQYKYAVYYIDDISVIEVNSKAYAGEDKLVCFGDSVFIGTNEIGIECEWYKNNLQIATGSGTWVKPNSQQEYVIRQDVCGTISYDTVQVSIKDLNCKPYVLEEVPNTFTPNNDGVNDTWQFSLGDGAVLNEITIYNRWGNLIHSNNQTSTQENIVLWDGRTTSGEPCSEGFYFYVLKYTDAKGDEQNKTGFISLFR